MEQKWVCNKCKYETTRKPENRNTTCAECGKGRHQVWNKCECGEWFHPPRTNQKYCSNECKYKYMQTGGKKGKKYPHTQRARIAICPVCNSEFRAVNDYEGRYAVYCSRECWNIRARKTNKCKYCGKEIITSNSVDKIYCSQKCLKSDYSETKKGENSHFWEGGKTKKSKLLRTRAEYREWRTKVFERDDYKCQDCGENTRTLVAHHIKEQCNYPELIYDVNNGLTLCHECHTKTDNYGIKAVLLNE